MSIVNPATAQRIAQAVDALRAQYAAALPVVEDEADDLLSSHAQKAAAANMRALGPVVEDWATRRRAWAERYQRDDGSAYSPARWYDEGAAHASNIRTATDVGYSADVWGSLEGTALATADDVGAGILAAADPFGWPWWAKGAAVVGLLWLARPYVAVLGKAKG